MVSYMLTFHEFCHVNMTILENMGDQVSIILLVIVLFLHCDTVNFIQAEWKGLNPSSTH